MITILGPTATGKTAFAAYVVSRLEGEIISADSRQVFRGMNLGTGKDYNDYTINGKQIPFHLIDIADPGEEYSVYEYQRDFLQAYRSILSRGKIPVLCGGTGLYIESVLDRYNLVKVPENPQRRAFLETLPDQELAGMLASYKTLHNVSDTSSRKRLIRALEIQEFHQSHPEAMQEFPVIDSVIFGILFPRPVIRSRITERLQKRLDAGMIDEVRHLLDSGLSPETLTFYGLEYKFLTQHILGNLSFDQMFRLLNTAIHQFAKRQMTWFRKMERNGHKINWIDGTLPNEEKIEFVLQVMNNNV
jgi:tRNA dimethylallyltransferase